jgi:type I restriction enzyme S subunit
MRLHLVHEIFSKTSQQTTGLANFSWGAVKRLPVRFPSCAEEQRRIAAALKLADETIKMERAELDATRSLKRSLVTHIFERGLTLGVATKPCKIHRCYTAMVPSHWDDGTLGRSLSLVEYGTNAPSNDYRGGYPVIAIPQVVAPHLTLSDVPFAEVPAAEAEALRLEADDVLLIRTNGNPEYIGKSTIVSKEVAAAHTIYASYLIRVRSDKEKLLGAYLNYFLASPLGRRQAGAAANTSAGNNNIGARAIKHFRLPRPPLDEQQRIVDLLNVVERQIDAQAAKVGAALELKRSLLQNLLTGKIRIPEGAIHA